LNFFVRLQGIQGLILLKNVLRKKLILETRWFKVVRVSIEAIVFFFLFPLFSSIKTFFFPYLYVHLVVQKRSHFRKGILCLWCVKQNLNLCHGTSKAQESIKNESKMKNYGPPKIRGQNIVKKKILKHLEVDN